MSRITMREAISQALWEEMERDPKVFILGEEVGVWGVLMPSPKGSMTTLVLSVCVTPRSQKR